MSGDAIIPALAVRDLRAGYARDSDIVHGIDLAVPPGRIVAIIGPNGSGKSTFAKALVGLLAARTGSISVNGKDVTKLSPARRIAAGLAYVPQEANVFATLSIAENLKLATEFLRARTGVGSARRAEILKLFPGVAQRPHMPAALLSGGQRQMLAFACALLANPEVLILDEPSAGLSPRLVAETMSAIGRIRDSGVTVVLVEQNVSAAMDIADDVVVLVAGRVNLQAPARTLTQANLSELFFGRAA